MNRLTQQMFDDWMPFLKESHRDEWNRYRLEEIAEYGEIVRIEDEFYAPPYENQISERHYFYAKGMMRILDAVRALGEEGLTHGLKLAPIPDSELSAAVCGRHRRIFA